MFPFRLPLARHVSREERAQHVEALHTKLAALSDPWLIVPTGETALRALTGKVGIGKHRGSLYAYQPRRDGAPPVKVIPTLHPAALFRQPAWERRCRTDWRRIAGDATFRELRLPDREHLIRPTLADVEAFVEDAAQHTEVLAVDIETPRRRTVTPVAGRAKKDGTLGKSRLKVVKGARRIVCVGLSFEPSWSLTIPTTLEYWSDAGVVEQVWGLIRRALAEPYELAGHNAYAFDRWWLAQASCEMPRLTYDTLVMHHVLNRLEAHALGYLASLYTREPFWKDDHKGDDDDGDAEPDVSSWNTYYTYNGKDVAVTRELADTLHGELARVGRLEHYLRKYRSLFDAVHRLALGGVRCDEARRAALARRYAMQVAGHGAWIEDATGTNLVGPKGAFSAKKLMTYLYTTLKLPRHVSHGKLTANEVAVRRLARTHGRRAITQGVTFDDFAKVVIRRRAALKLAGYVKAGVADADGRVRSTYKVTMLSDRFSSSKNPLGTGMNLQNQPVRLYPELRETLLPDEGHVFVSVDLAQAESRVVYAMTGDPQLVMIARSQPWEFDDHVRTAGLVFGLPMDAEWNGIRYPSSVTKDQRYFGKRTRHARNYKMGGREMSEQLEKEGVVRDEGECDVWLQTLEAREPAISAWHAEVRKRVLRDGRLTSSWGDVIEFDGERMDDQLYKRAYAWQPQLEVGSILNHWGFKNLDIYIVKHELRSRIRLHVHDELVVSTPGDLSEAYDVVTLLKGWLEQPRVYWGTPVSIPVEVKAGTSYRMALEWKRLPERQEFNEAVKEILHGIQQQA